MIGAQGSGLQIAHSLPDAQSSRRQGARWQESLAPGLEVPFEEASETVNVALAPAAGSLAAPGALTFPASILAPQARCGPFLLPLF